MKAISILIPTFNGVCTSLVADLQRQAEALAVSYEIIVADDGSTDADTIAENRAVNQLPHCRYIEQPRNVGRAAIRNFLARQAQFDWLLFIDSDMTVVNDRYLSNYLSDQTADVIDGGVCIGGDAESLRHNLRYRYEKASEHEHTAERRRQAPYRDFHTANFLIRRELMRSHPFDDRFRYYGYEDVLFGKQLRQDRIAITHIDNPMGFCTFESNADFVAKTEEGLRTLHTFRSELRGYSRLLTFVDGIHVPAVLTFIRLSHRLLRGVVRKNLCSSHPFPKLLSLYKVGYFVSL